MRVVPVHRAWPSRIIEADMSASNIPTIVISNTPGVTSSPLWWPRRQPSDDRVYAFDVSQHVTSEIIQASAAVMPSGTGEMQPSQLIVASNVISLRLNGGVAGRLDTVRIIFNTGTDEEEWLIRVPVDRALEVFPPIWPPSPFFGPSIFNTIPSLRKYLAINSMYL